MYNRYKKVIIIDSYLPKHAFGLKKIIYFNFVRTKNVLKILQDKFQTFSYLQR